MSRIVEIALPSEQTDSFLVAVKKINELVSLSVQRGVSVQPAGDVITIAVTNRFLSDLMRLLEKRGMLQDSSVSVTTTQPLSIISQPSTLEIINDTSEAIWEEMQAAISRESNMTVNSLIVMAISGVLATIGIATNALHVVSGAMLIAPGFEPIVRIALGLTTRNITWRKGLVDTLKGYIVLILAAATTTVILQMAGKNPLGGEASYLPAGVLISYWTTLTFPSIVVTATASIAGALVIVTHRSILTAGVMVALALVPSATIMVMALITNELYIIIKAFLRWIIEVSFVTVLSAFIFLWKKSSVHKRRMQV